MTRSLTELGFFINKAVRLHLGNCLVKGGRVKASIIVIKIIKKGVASFRCNLEQLWK